MSVLSKSEYKLLLTEVEINKVHIYKTNLIKQKKQANPRKLLSIAIGVEVCRILFNSLVEVRDKQTETVLKERKNE